MSNNHSFMVIGNLYEYINIFYESLYDIPYFADQPPGDDDVVIARGIQVGKIIKSDIILLLDIKKVSNKNYNVCAYDWNYLFLTKDGIAGWMTKLAKPKIESLFAPIVL